MLWNHVRLGSEVAISGGNERGSLGAVSEGPCGGLSLARTRLLAARAWGCLSGYSFFLSYLMCDACVPSFRKYFRP